jgi:predicted ATPase
MVFTVIGTQNVGKTTFLNDFMREYAGWETPKIDYRGIVKSKGLKLNREGNLYSQEILFDFTLQDLLKYGNTEKRIILDRSIIDAHAYTYWLYLNKPKESGVTEECVLKQYETIYNNIDLYDRIFYIPLDKCQDIEVVSDNFRDTDLEYRKQIGDIFKGTIQKLGLTNVLEIYGNREERIELVRNALGSKI